MKKLTHIKVIPLLLCLLIALPLVACSNTSDNNSDTNSSTTTEGTVTTTTENTELTPDIPMTSDMNGREITIYATDWWGYTPLEFVDISPDEYTGETLNDAANDRKITIESQYNCKIVQFDQSGTTSLQNSVLAGDNEYDIAIVRGSDYANLLSGGYLTNLDDLPYVDFDKPWWNKNAYDALALGGKHYGVCGDFSTNELMTVWMICFSKDMVTDYQLDSPYDLVNDGTWTFDKSVEMAKVVAHDVDGDSEMGINDVWGINYTTDTIIGILNSCGVTIAELDSDGVPQITLDSDVNVSKIIDIYTKLFDENYSVDTFALDLNDFDGEIFGAGRCLFLYTATHLVSALRQMDTDFGIIPYPKYDEEQTDYLPNTAGVFLSIVCVPNTSQNLDEIGLFMEAFAYEGNKTVVPAFYDTILMGKTVRDEESADMLDYIYNNINYDTGNLFNFDGIVSTVINMSADNVISTIESKKSSLTNAIDKVLNEING